MTPRSVTLPITRMTCANCTANIERVLGRLGGLAEARVNFAAETASVEFLPWATSVTDIIAAVEKAGFDAKPLADNAPEDAEAQARREEIRDQAHKFMAGGVLYPFTGPPLMLRQLHPMLAALAMAFSSVAVISNSLRLCRSRLI